MTESAEQIVQDATKWWTTGIVDIHPGVIEIPGYKIQDLIGNVTFPQMIWLMLRGDLPNKVQASLLEAALVASVDHGPHAPSIAIARMAMSCGVSLNGAMASAVNVLDDVHGGAGEQCMELLALIKSKNSGNLSKDVDDSLGEFIAANGKIIPGYGHRWHKVDPRSARLLGLVDEAAKTGAVSGEFV
jgi:citrate synthase